MASPAHVAARCSENRLKKEVYCRKSTVWASVKPA